MTRAVIIVAAIVMAACGGGHGSTSDAGSADATIADAGAPDAGVPDAMLPLPTTLAADAGDAADDVTSWTFPTTAVGAHAGVTVFVRDTGANPTAPLAVELVGTDAADFAIVTAGSTCAGAVLRPGDECAIRLQVTPTAAGARDASVHVDGGGAAIELALHTDAVVAADVHADQTAIDFGEVALGEPNVAPIAITNDGTDDVTLTDPPIASPPFSADTSACPVITAGTTCTVTATYQPQLTELDTGTITIPTSAGDLAIDVRGVGVRRVVVNRLGSGHGTISSAPAGIVCDALGVSTRCLGLFRDAVSLTATPDTGHLFAGWSSANVLGDSEPSCDFDPTCAFPDGVDVDLQARFEGPGAKTIEVTFAGSALGFAYVTDAIYGDSTFLVTCTASCSVIVPTGDPIRVYGFTPSTFAGWSGDCVASTNDCDLGIVTADRALTATFDRDDREVASFIPEAIITGLAMAPDGDVIVATADGVSKRTPTGAIVWSTPMQGGAHDLATDAAGEVFGAYAQGLFALDAGGNVRWTRAFDVAPFLSESAESEVSVSPDGTVIAAHTADGADVVDGMGADRFAISGVTADGLAVAPDGTVAIGTLSTALSGALDILRYDKTGAALTTLSRLPGDSSSASLVYDASGYLCAQTTADDVASVSRIAPSLAVVFEHDEPTTDYMRNAAIAVASTGELITLHVEHSGSWNGLQLEAFSPAGAITWTHVKPGTDEVNTPLVADAVLPTALAADPNKHVAIAGTWNLDVPWVQIYALP